MRIRYIEILSQLSTQSYSFSTGCLHSLYTRDPLLLVVVSTDQSSLFHASLPFST